MNCHRTCFDNQVSYCFMDSPASFEEARDTCNSTVGGRLATNIAIETYRALKRCYNTNAYYWIGLRSSTRCNSLGKGKFEYINNNQCVNLVGSVPRNDVCFAVQVQLPSPEQKNTPGRIKRCSEKAGFICRISQNPTTTAATTTAATPTTATTTTATTETTKTTSFLNNNDSEVTRNSTFNINQPSNVNFNAAGVVAGVMLTLVIIALLLALLYCWRYNKCNIRNIRNLRNVKIPRISFVKTANPDTVPSMSLPREDHIYYSVEPKLQSSRLNSSTYSIVTDLATSNTNVYCYVNDVTKPDAANSQQYDISDNVAATIATYTVEREPSYVNTAQDTGREYDSVFHPVNVTDDDAEVVNEPKQTENEPKQTENSLKEKLPQTEHQSNLNTSTVEYSTVRSLDKPTEVYSVVNKSRP